MNITVEKLPDCKAAIRVEVPREKVENQRAKITTLYHQSASIPGFRPGKAPAAMIARRYARQIEQELRERLIGEGYSEGSKQEGLEVLTATEIKDSSFNVDGTFSFVVEVITAPAFDLPDYKGIALKIPKAAINDDHVAQALMNLRERFADYPTVEGRALQVGDVAVIDYHGFIDGQPIRELAPTAADRLQEGQDYWVMVKEPNFLPGFCDALVGMNTGETRPVTVALPEDFPVKEIAGMTVVYETTLKEVKEQKLPEVDDAFARGTKIADDAASLPDRIRERLEADLNQKIDQVKREQVIGFLNETIVFDVPQDLIERATQRRVQELVEANQERGLSEDAIIENQEQILAAASQQAQYDVKTNFILNKIAEKEEIKATAEELQSDLLQQAMQSRATRAQVKKMLQNKALLERLREHIIIRKTVTHLIDNAVIEEVEPSSDESADAPAA